jgi:hypothetical protein
VEIGLQPGAEIGRIAVSFRSRLIAAVLQGLLRESDVEDVRLEACDASPGPDGMGSIELAKIALFGCSVRRFTCFFGVLRKHFSHLACASQ